MDDVRAVGYHEMDVKAAGYIRVSTEDQAKLGASMGVQEKRIDDICEQREWPLVDKYIDDGHSGADFTNRAELNRLREDAKAGRINTVLCSHLDRLGRDGAELIGLIFKEFKQLGVRCIFIEDGLDSFEDRDRLVIYIRCEQAEEYRERFVQRTRDSKIERAKQGRNVGGVAPIGFELDRETHLFMRCPEEAALVEKIVEMYLSGNGIVQIAHRLNDIAWPPVTQRVYLPSPRWCPIIRKEKRTGSCYVRPAHKEYEDHCVGCIEKFGPEARIETPSGVGKSTVRRILCQDLSPGVMVWGRTKSNGKGRVRVDDKLHIRAEKKTHDSLFDDETLEQIRQIREERKTTSPRTQIGKWLLTGIINCECGAAMSGHSDTKEWTAYICSGRKYKGVSVCDVPTLNTKIIHPYIEDHLREFVAAIDDQSFFESDSWLEESATEVNLRNAIDQLEKDIEDNAIASEKVLSLFLQGDRAPAIVRGRLDELEKEKMELQGQLADRQRQLIQAVQARPTKDQLIEVARDFEKVWSGTSIADKKRLVKMFVERIDVYKDGRIEVWWAF